MPVYVKHLLYENYSSFLKKYFGMFPIVSRASSIKTKFEPVLENCGYRNYKDHQNILVIHTSKIGDFVIMSMCIRYLREKYPRAKITVVCNECVRSLNSYLETKVDVIYVNDVGKTGNKVFTNIYLNLILLLAKTPIDDCYICQAETKNILVAYFSGCCRIHSSYGLISTNEIGVCCVEDFVTDSIEYYPQHITGYYLSCLEDYNENINFKYFIVDDADLNYKSKTLISICCNGSVFWKHSPITIFVDFILFAYSNNNKLRFQLLGDKYDVKDSLEIIRLVSEANSQIKIDSFVSQLTLYESAIQLSYSFLVVSNDSCLAHISAAVNVPCITLYSCNIGNCFFWRPYGVSTEVVVPDIIDKCKKCQVFRYGNKLSDKEASIILAGCVKRLKSESLINSYIMLMQKLGFSNQFNKHSLKQISKEIQSIDTVLEIKKHPFFSIILFSDCIDDYLLACLSSLQLQSFDDFEVLFVACSYADNFDMLISEKFVKLRNRIKFFTVYGDRWSLFNSGISLASGDYCIFIDQYCCLRKLALQEIHSRLCNFKGIDILHFQKFFVSNVIDNFSIEDSSLIERHEANLLNRPACFKVDKVFMFSSIFEMFYYYFANCYKREFLLSKKIRFPDLHHRSDLYFMVFAFLQASKVVIDPEIIYFIFRVEINDLMSFEELFINFLNEFSLYSKMFLNLEFTAFESFKFYSGLFANFIDSYDFKDLSLEMLVGFEKFNDLIQDNSNVDDLIMFFLDYLILKVVE